MFNVCAALQEFYDTHVRLGNERRQALAGHRDANLKRLSDGLTALKNEGRVKCGPYAKSYTQGSFAMHTLNQHADNDYDIDVGVLFEEYCLPSSALDSRNLVAEALVKAGGNFAKDPESRTNAVTVWYSEGHHVDFAVYRRRKTAAGLVVLEHASTDWRTQDPLDVQTWFDDRVQKLSPSAGSGRVPSGQLRRIIRFAKAFTRSRDSWSLPGGMITSALTVECYKPDAYRDDAALHNTLAALSSRLSASTAVRNPVEGTSWLTSKTEHENQVKRMRDRLSENMPKLAVLFGADCTEYQARSAWDWVFNHSYWRETPAAKTQRADERAAIGAIDIRVDVAFQQGGPARWEYRLGKVLPKNVWLKFSILRTSVQSPYDVRWLVENAGDEAVADNGLTHESSGAEKNIQWERTLYKGAHRMICELRKGSAIVARRIIPIQIGAK